MIFGKFSHIHNRQSDFTARFFNDEGRFTQVDPMWQKYPSISPYVRVADNPLKFKDNNGKELTAVYTGSQWVLVDKMIVPNLTNANRELHNAGINVEFSSHFRTTRDQGFMVQAFGKWNGKTGAAPEKSSLHEAGFAFDMRISKLTEGQKLYLKLVMGANGFSNLSDGKEAWHFKADPKKYGYKSKEAARVENLHDFWKKAGGFWLTTHDANTDLNNAWQTNWNDYYNYEDYRNSTMGWSSWY